MEAFTELNEGFHIFNLQIASCKVELWMLDKGVSEPAKISHPSLLEHPLGKYTNRSHAKRQGEKNRGQEEKMCGHKEENDIDGRDGFEYTRERVRRIVTLR